MYNNRSCVLSIDAGGTFIKAALICNNGMIIEDSFIKIPVKSNGSPESIKAPYTRVASLGVEAAKRSSLALIGIGICIPGPFDYDKGISLMKHKYASIYRIPMRPWFEEVVGKVPIHFVHDSTAFILGATWDSCYAQFKRIAGVIIGTGLGFASMFDSKVFCNPQGGPGISIYKRSYREKTAEEYVSRRALIANYRKLVPKANDEIDVIDISNLARTGQTEAIRVFEEMGVYLSEILHDVMAENMFECLLLGGAISKSADLFLPALKRGLSDIPTLVIIEPVKNIDNAALLGIARAMFA
jgi:glucokinase